MGLLLRIVTEDVFAVDCFVIGTVSQVLLLLLLLLLL